MDMQPRFDQIEQRFDRLEKRLDQQDARLDEHGAKLDEHGAKLDEHSAKLDEHSAKLDEHGAKLDEHGAKLDEHGARLDRIEQTLAEHGRLHACHQKSFDDLFAFLNEKFAEQRRHVDIQFESLRDEMRAFREEQRDHGRRLNCLEGDVTVLQGNFSSLEQRVTRLEKLQ